MSPAALILAVAAVFLVLGAVAIAVQIGSTRLSRQRAPEPCLPCEGYAGDCTCEWHCGSLACDPKKGAASRRAGR